LQKKEVGKMQKTNEIKIRLNATTEWQLWMDELQDDPRKSVQALLAS